MKKYERLFIVIGLVTTAVLAVTGLWFWLKHSLSIVITDIDDLFGSDGENGVEPEVVDASYEDDENDEYGDICD